jgi:hypothetical protein
MPDHIVETFRKIRDIPYSIPLSYGAEDRCCSGKHKQLLAMLEKEGYQLRWRICTFKWSNMKLPEELVAIPHQDDSSHAYLEIKIGEEWKKIDATWDKPLGRILPVNEWDRVSNTPIAVPFITTYSPEESLALITNETKEMIETDLANNGAFYKEFNEWLQQEREKQLP